MKRRALFLGILLTGIALVSSVPAFAGPFVINPSFTSNFNTNFGANATAAQNAWKAAANVFTSNFSDSITVNITVDAVAGTGVFGQSNTLLQSFSYATLYGAVVADAKTSNDATAIGPGGSVTAIDPTGGKGTFWVTTAQAKALGIGSFAGSDGTTTFGTGNPFTFSGPVAAGTYDFQGVAAHEISEVLGRLGISGGTIASTPNSYSLIDLFSYTGAGVRALGSGPGENFSINNGSTLLKLYNDAAANGLDTRDWAPGTNDSFNQFSNSGVTNSVSAVDLQELDVIGYDLQPAPEPSTIVLFSTGMFAAVGAARRRLKK